MGELEEKENPPTESHQESEEPKETDKMLQKKTDNAKQMKKSNENLTKTSSSTIMNPEKNDNKKNKDLNGEEIVNIPETETETENDINPVTEEGREVKPKKIPIGGIKMPGFFTKIKPRGEGDGADGELLENEGNDNKDKIEENKTKKDQDKLPSIGERIRNFFSRKPLGKKKEENKNNESGGTENENPPPKKGLLNAIKLPIANMIPKKTEEDVELGSGPGTKAGLASMETLDDSLKDQDTVDRVPKNNDESLDKTKANEESKVNEEVNSNIV